MLLFGRVDVINEFSVDTEFHNERAVALLLCTATVVVVIISFSLRRIVSVPAHAVVLWFGLRKHVSQPGATRWPGECVLLRR